MATGGEMGDAEVRTSEDVHEFTCSACHQDDHVTRATHYCPECDTCYCKACLCDHDVIGRSGIRRWGKQVQKGMDTDEEADMCMKHPTHEIVYHCDNHGDLCCLICMTVDHKDCDKVKPITDKTNFDATADIDVVRTNIIEVNRLIHLIESESKFKDNNAVRTHGKFIDQIHQLRDDINHLLSCIEDNANVLIRQQRDKIERERKFVMKISTDIDNVKNKLKRSFEGTKQFTNIKRCRKIVGERLNVLTSVREEGKDTFVPLPKDKVDTVLNTLKDMKTIVTSAKRLHLVFDFKIGGVCQIDTGDLIVADTTNKRLVQLDDSLTVTRTLTLEDTPTHVCNADDSEIVVLLGDKTAQFVTVGDSLEPSDRITLGENVGHIAALKDCIITACKLANCNYSQQQNSSDQEYIWQYHQQQYNRGYYTCTCACNVQCYNRQGDQVWTVQFKVGSHDYNAFSLPVCTLGASVYVCDHTGVIYILDKDGKQGETISLGKHATRLTADDGGFVYACTEDAVYKVKPGIGATQIPVASLNIRCPTFPCWDKRYERLVLTCQKRNVLYWVQV